MSDHQELWHSEDAFNAWYQETAPRLRVFLRRILPTGQAADDVMQETYTHIWQRPDNYDPQRGSLRAYLYGVARRRAADCMRRQKPSAELDFDPSCPRSLERDSLIADAFHRITPEQRTLLWLREVEGQSYQELAAILDIPIGTVRSRLFAAREALRACWHSAPQPTGGPHESR